jgi:uncharacterized protein
MSSSSSATAALETAADRRTHVPAESLIVHPLASGQEREALRFLEARPLHTVIMSSFIRDNGLVSPLNRGTFYACHSRKGRLEGVALIGHATLIETRSEAALAAFARLAHDCPQANLIIGEQEKVKRFWNYYTKVGQVPHLLCRELLFEQRWPMQVREVVRGLRRAMPDDLARVMTAHAQMALEEIGVNLLETDPEGFRQRCARRIEQGRVWVWVENERLIFKVDVVSETPDVVYLEGLYVHPEERGKGHGSCCLTQLSRDLLSHTKSISLLVNEHNRKAHEFYRRVGYRLRAYYDTIFLKQGK